MSIDSFKNLFLKSYNAIEACKRQNLSEQMIEDLRVRLRTTQFVPKCLISSQLMLFLNASKGDIELAAQKLDKYYELKHQSPEFFKNRDLASEEVQQCLDCLILVALPVTPDNCMMICQKLRKFNPKDYNFDGACKTFIMKTEATTFKQGPRDGIIFFDDLDGVSIFHLFRPSLSTIRKGMRFLQEASPLEVKAIHIMNCVPFINRMVAMAKPFMRSDMLNKVHFHPPDMDYNELQTKYGIPKSHLPSDYGGDLKSLEDLHVEQRKQIMELREYFLMEESHMNYEYDQYFEEWENVRSRTLPRQDVDYIYDLDEENRNITYRTAELKRSVECDESTQM